MGFLSLAKRVVLHPLIPRACRRYIAQSGTERYPLGSVRCRLWFLDVPTPQIQEEIAAVIQLIPQEHVSERIIEQTRCSVPQIQDRIVES